MMVVIHNTRQILSWFIAVFLFVIFVISHRIKPETDKMTIAEIQQLTKELYERRLETLQLYPKSEQRKIIDLALMNRKELKEYLIDRFNIGENNTNTELKKPAARHETHAIVGGESASVSRRERTKYLLNVEDDNCTRKEPFLVILVHSHADNRAQRMRIRNTWAGVTSYKERTIRTVFLLGKPADQQAENVPRMTVREGRRYDDMVLGDFVDTYRNLTTKHLMGYQWVINHCRPLFVVKVDDDVIVNVFRLIDFLRSPTALAWHTNAIYCSAFVNQGPRRDKRDKWYVSRLEYPHDKYPKYCEGFAYVTSSEAVRSIYDVSQHAKQLFWIDDVFVTGILADEAGTKRIQFPFGFGYITTDSGVPRKYFQNNLFFLQKYNKDADIFAQVWQAIFDQHKLEVFTTNSRYLHFKLPGRT